MKKYVHKSQYFYGNKISNYGLENGYMDYSTLAKAFDMVINNEIISTTYNIGDWEIVNGSEYYYEDKHGDIINAETFYNLSDEEQENYTENYFEIFQYYIISDRGYEILSELTNEIVFYNEILDMYVWGVTHWGTRWDYVLTDIKIELGDKK